MMIALYQNENPGKGIDRLFYASQAGFHADLEEGLRSLTATPGFKSTGEGNDHG